MGFIVYEGPSQLDGKPIVMIVTETSNQKTGNMLQTWILRRYINPVKAVMEGHDESICGDCRLKKTICYVAVHQAPNQIYKSYKAGKYEKITDYSFFKDKLVRFGSYGDVTAVPVRIWKNILKVCKGHTSYSHQWKNPKFKAFSDFSMASVETPQQQKEAELLGWRTFRIKNKEDERFEREIICPASIEAGKKLQCETCLYCNGGHARKNVVINLHGLQFKVNNYQKMTEVLKSENKYALPLVN